MSCCSNDDNNNDITIINSNNSSDLGNGEQNELLALLSRTEDQHQHHHPSSLSYLFDDGSNFISAPPSSPPPSPSSSPLSSTTTLLNQQSPLPQLPASLNVDSISIPLPPPRKSPPKKASKSKSYLPNCEQQPQEDDGCIGKVFEILNGGEYSLKEQGETAVAVAPESLDASVLSKLSPKFRILSVCYSGCFINGHQHLHNPHEQEQDLDFDLLRIARCFGDFGSCHSVVVNGSDYGLWKIDQVITNDKNFSFVLIKAGFMGLNVSLKIYKPGYFQIFGLSDLAELDAAKIAEIILQFVQEKLSDPIVAQGTNIQLRGHTPLQAMSILAFHHGVSDLGYGFDLDTMEMLFRGAEHLLPAGSLNVSRHSRNHSLIVNFLSSTGTKLGSQIFHATGTTQVMGVRGESILQIHATRLRDFIKTYPHILTIPKSKRRIRVQPSTARAKRTRTQQLQQQSDDNNNNSNNASTSSTTTTTTKRKASAASTSTQKKARASSKQQVDEEASLVLRLHQQIDVLANDLTIEFLSSVANDNQ